MTHTPGPDPLALLGKATAALKLENMPANVVMRAKQRVLDTIGCLVAGYEAGLAKEVRDYVLAQGGKAEATLFPGGPKTTVALASFAHASYIHGLELSDAAPRGTAHPGNEIVPVAVAYAERLGVGGEAILPAVVAGYEVEIRLGRAIFPSAFYRGWWTPGFLGTIGAASAAGYMLKLDAKGMDNAIGIALNFAPTAMAKANEEGESVKWVIGGQACSSGITAAELAARGAKGMRDVVGGWLPVIAPPDKILPERLNEGISADGQFEQWEIDSGIVTKHYATVGPLTATLDATFELVTKHDIKPEDIEEIHVDAMRRTAIFNTQHPENEVAARASLPYCVAVATVTRDPVELLGRGFRDEMLKDKRVWDTAHKVRITENEDYERRYPTQSLARVTMKLKGGKVHTLESDRSANPRYLTPSDADIEKKFRLIATDVLGRSKTDRVVELCLGMEKLKNVDPLVEALRL